MAPANGDDPLEIPRDGVDAVDVAILLTDDDGVVGRTAQSCRDEGWSHCEIGIRARSGGAKRGQTRARASVATHHDPAVQWGNGSSPIDLAGGDVEGHDGFLPHVVRKTVGRLVHAVLVPNWVDVGVAGSNEDLVPHGVDGRLRAPDTDAGPAFSGGESVDLPNLGEFLGNGIEGVGGEVSDEITTRIRRVKGGGLFVAGGADEYLSVIESGAHGNDGERVGIDLDGGQESPGVQVERDEKRMGLGGEEDDVAVDLGACSGSGNGVVGLDCGGQSKVEDDGGHVDLPDVCAGAIVEGVEGAVGSRVVDGLVQHNRSGADAERVVELAVLEEVADGGGIDVGVWCPAIVVEVAAPARPLAVVIGSLRGGSGVVGRDVFQQKQGRTEPPCGAEKHGNQGQAMVDGCMVGEGQSRGRAVLCSEGWSESREGENGREDERLED